MKYIVYLNDNDNELSAKKYSNKNELHEDI